MNRTVSYLSYDVCRKIYHYVILLFSQGHHLFDMFFLI